MEIITRSQALNRLKEITPFIKNPKVEEKMQRLVDKIFDPKARPYFPYMPHPSRAFSLFFNNNVSMEEPVSQFIQELKYIVTTRGYLSIPYILTAQEHILDRSTPGKRIHLEYPHKPIGLVDGSLTYDEVVKARRLYLVTYALIPYYTKGRRSNLRVSLEPLDSDGNTVRDPRPISKKKLNAFYDSLPEPKVIPYPEIFDACVRNISRNDAEFTNFPFRRD